MVDSIYGMPLHRRCHLLRQAVLMFFGATPDDRHRFWLHFPVGVLAAVLTSWNAPLGLGCAGIFLAYEFINEWGKSDKSWKDVFGFAIAYGVTGLALMLRDMM